MVQDTNSLSLAGGVVAALAAGKLLLATRYPRTWLTVCRWSFAFWRYVFYYGVLGAVATWVIFQTSIGRMPFIGGIPTRIFVPIAVGLIGTLAKASFVGAMPGADQFHMTVRAALLLFEPRLLQQIQNDEYFAVKCIVKKHERDWPDLGLVKTAIRKNIPDQLVRAERLLFLDELEKQMTVEDAMMLYYRFVGSRGFGIVFGVSLTSQYRQSRRTSGMASPVPPAQSRTPNDVLLRGSGVDVGSRRKSPIEGQIR